MTGKVKWFNSEKSYGFITADSGEDVFAHYSHVLMDGYKTLTEGQDVQFDIVETDKGLQAENIEVI